MERRNIKESRIGVLMGGSSSEREISLKSGRSVMAALVAEGYDAVAIDMGRDVYASLKDEKVDLAFISLHGRLGEDGSIQGLLEIMGIPYTGAGLLSSAVCMDKVVSKRLLKEAGVETPDYEVLKREGASIGGVKLPVVVKPPAEGSTLGISIARTPGELESAVAEAGKYCEDVLVEDYIEGKELTVSIIDGEILPIVEIKPRGGFYDFAAKYTKGEVEFKVPASLEEELGARVSEAALSAYRALGCRGAARVDIMLSEGGEPYVLEVNTVPGMTEHSLLPMAAEAAGIKYSELVERMLGCARLDSQGGAAA